ncbi:unnamed protein product [Brugia pahangi]|uniref:Ovule protein n=1 Tax=Brugia pahangi TaxID=6280 RepID=A0A0N4TCS6_BRUPA|nr:unnamed protein product [Brugia pahangi]
MKVSITKNFLYSAPNYHGDKGTIWPMYLSVFLSSFLRLLRFPHLSDPDDPSNYHGDSILTVQCNRTLH